jgi:hypothetical protein
MLQSQEFDLLDEAFKVVLEQGAKRVSYGVDTSPYFSFEKGCKVPISDELRKFGHPGTVTITCSISKHKETGKWCLIKWVEGTGGSIDIDPTRPGVALGAAFIEYELQQIAGEEKFWFSSKEEVEYLTDSMSQELKYQWGCGVFERMFLNDSKTPFHGVLEKVYLEGRALLEVDSINKRVYLYNGIRYCFHYERGHGVGSFGAKGGWQIHDAKPVQEDDSHA